MKRASKKIALLLIVCITMPAISGCWGYRDVDKLFVVMGGFLDKDPITNQYILQVEILRPQGGQESKMTQQVVSGKGDTIFAAIRDTIIAAGGRMYWGHTQVWVVSQPVAQDGILDTLDMISRGAEVRTDTNVMVFDEASTERLVKANEGSNLHDSMSQFLYEMVEDYKRAGAYVPTPIWEVLGQLSSSDRALTVPLLEVYEDNGQQQVGVKGVAVFKGDKMVGYIDKKYAKFLYGYQGKISNEYILFVPESIELPATTIEVSNSEYTTKITRLDQGVKATVRCDIRADLTSFQSRQNFLTADTIGFIEREYEQYIVHEFSEMVHIAQKEYGVDIFGFGQQVHIHATDYWKTVKDDWNSAFRDLPVEIDAHVKITMTGLAHEPIQAAGGE